jgi:integrase
MVDSGDSNLVLEHTPNHSHPCPACLSAEENMYSLSAREPFPAAAWLWYESHSVYIQKNTQRSYRQYIKTLEQFLQNIRLKDIRPGTLREYRAWRSQTACGDRIRCEVVCLQMILKEAGLWKNLKDTYKPPPHSQKRVRQNMSPEEEQRFLRVCLAKPSRLVAGHCLRVMMNTSAGFGELSHVRRKEVIFDGPEPIIIVKGGAKNEYRVRSITLNRIALESMRWIVHRWEDLGGSSPEQYVLPHRSVRGSGTQFDVPMGHIYNAAKLILADAGLPHMVPYDMRSCAITKILSDPECSDQMYEELAGHSTASKEIRMRYSQQRLKKKAAITDKLCEYDESAPRPKSPEPQKVILFPGGKRA